MLTAEKVRMATRMVGPITQNFLRRTARPTALRSSSSATLIVDSYSHSHTYERKCNSGAPPALRRHYGCLRVKAVSERIGSSVAAPLVGARKGCCGHPQGCPYKALFAYSPYLTAFANY